MRKKLYLLCAVLLLASGPTFAKTVDTDNDGIRDRKDACPSTPVGSKVDRVGCPVDSDADGVPNGVDRCSRTPARTPVDDQGCPTDTDDDGITDAADTCASTPAGAKVDAKGCPWDSDGDLILEGLDRCSGTPMSHRVDGFGCPVDSDHDGVNDSIDRCADSSTRETVDAEGCRVMANPVFSEGVDRVRLEGVTFEKNKIELPAESAAFVADAAAALMDHPDVRVEIAVHTDRAGSAAVNRELSQRRAEWVKSYLVALGIEESRLVAKGYGERGPIKERAVELVKIS